MQSYCAILTAAGFDASIFDEGQVYLLVGALIRDRDFDNRDGKYIDGRLVLSPEMTPEEQAALRQRMIDGNRWLAKKLAPQKPKRGTAF